MNPGLLAPGIAILLGAILLAWLRRASHAQSPPHAAFRALERATERRDAGDSDGFEGHLLEAIRLARSSSARAERAVLLQATLELAEHRRSAGRPSDAVGLFEEAVRLSDQVSEALGVHCRASAHSRLGILAQQAGEQLAAERHYLASLDLEPQCEWPRVRAELVQAAFNLGLLYNERGQDALACTWWERAADLGERTTQPPGLDPAALAAFNRSEVCFRNGDRAGAQRFLERAHRMGESSGSPLGRFAACKAAYGLAAVAEHDAMLPGSGAARWLERCIEHGAASPVPETAWIMSQAESRLGEWCGRDRRHAEAATHFAAAARLAARVPEAGARVLATQALLQQGLALAEDARPMEAVVALRAAMDAGRASAAVEVRELAAQSACNLHRLLCGLDRWADADAVAEQALELARSLGSGLGQALQAAALHGRGVQLLHTGAREVARASLASAAALGWESDTVPGRHVAVDASFAHALSLLEDERIADALPLLDQAASAYRPGIDAAGLQSKAAQAACHLGHAHLMADDPRAAAAAYERAIELGRGSGHGEGRAAAANGALNLGTLLGSLEPESFARGTTARRRELYALARSLGRLSGLPRGADCAERAERAAAELERE